jgi:hypothetical protein
MTYTLMAASRFWCVWQRIRLPRAVSEAFLQVLSGKVPYWWISEESEVLSAKVQGTEPFLPSVEV